MAIICLAVIDSRLSLFYLESGAWSRLEGHFEKNYLANKYFLPQRRAVHDIAVARKKIDLLKFLCVLAILWSDSEQTLLKVRLGW
ncbi:hypothetical protein Plhal304r1_c012g0047591 [Plasmopara halstedii]